LIPFGLATITTDQRSFVGVSSATSNATNVDPLTSTANGKVGMACIGNTGNWSLIHNLSGAAPTQIALGANFPVNNTTWYHLRLRQLPGATTITYTVTNKNTDQTVEGTLSTNLPANAIYMHFYAWVTNNTTASAVAIAYGKIIMEFGV
jgi:hypothetical protein